MAALITAAALLYLHKHSTIRSFCDGNPSTAQPDLVRYPAHRLSPNAKIVHFVRHAEGHHNVAGRKNPVFGYMSEELVDAQLTPKGIEQCEALRQKAKSSLRNVELVVTSPLRRTMQTAMYTFPFLKGAIPWIAIEHVREQTGLHPCDRRLSITEHKENFPFIDFDLVENDSDPLYSLYTLREPAIDVQRRGRDFMRWLQSRPEKEIIVVSHAGYLRQLFRGVLHFSNAKDAEEFSNCEMRTIIFNFDEVEED